MRKVLLTVLKLVVLAGCLVYLARIVDFSRLVEVLGQYHPGKILVLLAWFVLAFIVLGLRLDFLCDRRAGLLLGTEASFLGQFVNSALPARLGEAAKAWLVHKRSSITLAGALGAVFWERFADLNIFLLLMLTAVAAMGADKALIPVGLVVAGVWAGLILIRKRPGAVRVLAGWLPGERLRLLATEFMAQLAREVPPGFALGLSVLTVLVWIQYVGETLLVIFWLAHLPIGIGPALTVFVLATTGMAVPSTPAGIGVYEAIFVYALGRYGVGQEEALAAALVLRGVQLIPTFLVGGLVLVRAKFNLSELKRGL